MRHVQSRQVTRFGLKLPAARATAMAFAVSLGAFCAPTSAQNTQHMTQPNLESTCPGAGAALADSLAGLARERRDRVAVDVKLTVVASRITAIESTGSGRAHQRAVTRAVRDLSCDGPAIASQSLAIRIQFHPDDTRATDFGNTAVAGTAASAHVTPASR